MYIFIADIHLKPWLENDIRRFVSWFENTISPSDEVFILGDLFEYYHSGMDLSIKPVLELLERPNIHIMPGNRDFLLWNLEGRRIDIIREEEFRTVIHGKDVLLAHGHTLTEGDLGFRVLHLAGWPLLRLTDRILSPRFKDRLAMNMVNSSAVVRAPRAVIPPDIAQRRSVDTVICGHLHRQIITPGLIVLPAFLDSSSWLVWDEDGPGIRHGSF